MEEKKEGSNHEHSKRVDTHSDKSGLTRDEKTMKYPYHPIRNSRLQNSYHDAQPPKLSHDYVNPISRAMDVNFGLDNLINGLNKIPGGSYHYPVSTNYTSGYLRNYSSVKKIPAYS